ncbi:tail fiber protein [Chromatiaceae bacterium AAb-1]|nr:tail fiber protein [Chromatiaceae bacterium AAb-1]
MSDQFVGEIRIFAGNYAPGGWAFCNGQELSISQYPALFALLGTTYGGNGHQTFAVPDFRGRIPIHQSAHYPLGQRGGTETVTLTEAGLPAHAHIAQANNQSATTTNASPENSVWGFSAINSYQSDEPNAQLAAEVIASVGGNQPHNNIMPSFGVTFIIALNGLYPVA